MTQVVKREHGFQVLLFSLGFYFFFLWAFYHFLCLWLRCHRMLPRSVFKSSNTTDCLPRYIPQRSQQRAQLLVGEEGFRYSLVRTVKPLWLLLNPLQHIMCIMAAQWAFVTSQERQMWGFPVRISLHLSLASSRDITACLSHNYFLAIHHFY